MTIYTAIFGPYDTLKEPKVTEGWKYICFTDQPFTSKVWSIVKMSGGIKEARIIKILPHLFLKDDFTIWVDGSFQINCDLNEFVKNNHKGGMSMMLHPWRDCVYEETKACIDQNRADKEDAQRQIDSYRHQGLPRHSGLGATGIVIRNGSKETIKFCDMWWDEMVTMRDQLSLGYLLWKMPKVVNFFELKYWDNEYFIFTHHDKNRRT